MNLVLASRNRQAFFGHIRTVEVLPNYHVLRVIREPSYPPRVRAAALRILVDRAPIDVTKGRPFAERRRLVRKHYKV